MPQTHKQIMVASDSNKYRNSLLGHLIQLQYKPVATSVDHIMNCDIPIATGRIGAIVLDLPHHEFETMIFASRSLETKYGVPFLYSVNSRDIEHFKILDAARDLLYITPESTAREIDLALKFVTDLQELRYSNAWAKKSAWMTNAYAAVYRRTFDPDERLSAIIATLSQAIGVPACLLYADRFKKPNVVAQSGFASETIDTLSNSPSIAKHLLDATKFLQTETVRFKKPTARRQIISNPDPGSEMILTNVARHSDNHGCLIVEVPRHPTEHPAFMSIIVATAMQCSLLFDQIHDQKNRELH